MTKPLLLLLLLFALSSQVAAQTESSSVFLYLKTPVYPDRVADVWAFNPADGTHQPYAYPLNEDYGPILQMLYGGLYLSPNGDWLSAVVMSGHYDRPDIDYFGIHLWNIHTGETRLITQPDWNYIQLEWMFHAEYKKISWSPDGQAISFIMGRITQEETFGPELYVYTLATDQVQRLTDDDGEELENFWLNDSDKIGVFSRSCKYLSQEICDTTLELYKRDDEKFSLSKSVYLGALPAYGNMACDGQSSPDGRYVLFIGVCDVTTGYHPELYMYDRAEERLRVLTHFGDEAYLNWNSMWARYQINWFDNDTFLVGVDYRIGGEAQHKVLMVYDLPDVEPRILSERYGSRYIFDSVHAQVLLSPVTADFDDEFSETSPVTTVDFERLQSVSDDVSLPNTAGLTLPSWSKAQLSPDGRWLFTETQSSNDGVTLAASLIFERADLTQEIYRFPDSDGGQYIIPLGWVSKDTLPNP